MIYTFSRNAVEAGLELVEPYVIISISTPEYDPRHAQRLQIEGHAATLPPDEFRLDILRLAFWDVDEMNILSPMDHRWNAQVRLYSAEDARRVAAFVRGWAVNLVIHCDAGISRSQGMANAIADHLSTEANEPVPVKHSVRGMPNRYVYRLTWEALRPAEKNIPPAELAARAWAGSMKQMRPDVTLPVIAQPHQGRDKYRIRFRGITPAW